MDINNFILMLLERGNLRTNPSEGSVLCNLFGGRLVDWHRMRPFFNAEAYIFHRLRYCGDQFRFLAHRVIWTAANGLVPSGLMLDHINRIRIDNRLDNLRLVDSVGNVLNSPRRYGEANPAAKLTEEQVKEIREAYEQRVSLRRLACRYGISESQAYNIVSKICWSGQNHPQREFPRRRVNNRMLTWNGKTMCQSEWARELGVSAQAIAYRVSHGLPVGGA